MGRLMTVFSEEDRRIFQVLIDHHLDPTETIASLLDMGPMENARYFINHFCAKYQCITRAQILDFERIGLHPFFRLTEDPLEDTRYCLRQFKMVGTQLEYFSLCVTPDLTQMPPPSKTVYPITKIYRPTNNIRLLYEEAHPLSFNDEWFLNLKEVMVEQEMGDIVYHQEIRDETPLSVTSELLDQIREIYLNEDRLIDYRIRSNVKNWSGFLATYLDITLPNMANYILLLNNIRNPLLFIGGFVGRFPLTELYEMPNALIARIQTPELNYAKFDLSLHTHLISISTPSLWLLTGDERRFDLLDQWENGHWKKA